MRLCLSYRHAVLKGGSAVISPGHLEDTGCALDAFYPETFAEALPAAEVRDELGGRDKKRCLLSGCQVVEVPGEACQPGVSRQSFLTTNDGCGV